SDRMDYTVIGASINVGSRIEGLNKEYGTQILVTQSVVDAAGPGFAHRPVDRVLPKGAVYPLDIHELLGADVSARTTALCRAWQDFYRTYLGRDWKAAEELLVRF